MQPSFIHFKIFKERRNTSHTLNRHIFTGFCVLDLSKLLMYDFQYNHIKSLYPGHLLFIDKDSLTYSIQTDNIYEDMKQHKDLYDFSGYPKEHFCFSNENKKVIGKMKDELKVWRCRNLLS